MTVPAIEYCATPMITSAALAVALSTTVTLGLVVGARKARPHGFATTDLVPAGTPVTV